MHAMTTWTKQKEHEWLEEGRKNVEPVFRRTSSWEGILWDTERLPCRFRNNAEQTLLAEDVIGTGTRPGIPLGSPSCSWWCCWHLDCNDIKQKNLLLPQRSLLPHPSSIFLLSFLSISLLVFFALICTGIERIIASQNANTTSGCRNPPSHLKL